jgi:hypothetical protein
MALKLRENTEDCKGFEESNCCGTYIYDESDICSSCKEHCSNACDDCEDPCIDIKTIN